MSYTSSKSGSTFSAGFFLLNDEECLRETALISPNHAQKVTRGNSVIVPAGAVIPSNDGNAVGLLYEDIDVTYGEQMGSIVTDGIVYGDRLPAPLESSAASALTNITVKTAAPSVIRPAEFAKKLGEITVASVAGTASGDTKVTASGYTLKNGESYVYKTAETTAPAVALGDDLTTGWTALTNGADITATNGHKITVAAKDVYGKAVAAGSATVVSKA